MVRVEVGKKEVRSRRAQWMRLSNFIDDYPRSDLYMVHSIDGRLKGIVSVRGWAGCDFGSNLSGCLQLYTPSRTLRSASDSDTLTFRIPCTKLST